MSAAALTTSIRLDNELADYANDHIYIKEWKGFWAAGYIFLDFFWVVLVLVSLLWGSYLKRWPLGFQWLLSAVAMLYW